jgi:nicotinamide phosphoribosyltransferase
MQKRSIIFLSDSYKYSHAPAYKPGVTNVYSYLESRGGRYKETVFFLLQYYLKEHLEGVVVTMKDIDNAEVFCAAHFGRLDVFNRAGWEHIVNVHGGKLPLRIKAVPEGTVVPVSNILLSIEATDPKCWWLVNFVETLLMKLWYPITIATQSMHIRQDILKTLEKTGTPEEIDFKCHDFGYRGCSSEEQAAIGAAAHLLSFMGTDTVAGIHLLMDYYKAGVCGFSIPATEHSNMCSFGKSNEIDAFDNLISKAYPTGPVAGVGDTWNIYNAAEFVLGTALRDKILYRNGRLILRPDSGDFFETVPKILSILWDKFEGKPNKKGYKVLHNNIRLIQGDGMDAVSIPDLYHHINQLGWSSDNLATGSGGGLLVKNIDRDTQKFAIKASAIQLNGEWVGIQKDPVTDSGKRSKMGRLKLIIDATGQYKTVSEGTYGEDQLKTVFENGVVLKEFTLDEVKANMRK